MERISLFNATYLDHNIKHTSYIEYLLSQEVRVRSLSTTHTDQTLIDIVVKLLLSYC